MSYAFFKTLQDKFPDATIHVIVKSNIAELVELFPQVSRIYYFNKKVFSDLWKLRKFAKTITEKYDYFFCLPDSFSSAWMGAFINASTKIGYRKELRQLLLTKTMSVPENMHRVEKYCNLLNFDGKTNSNTIYSCYFESNDLSDLELGIKLEKEQNIVLNLVSVDDKRTFDKSASIKIIEAIQTALPAANILIIGTEKAKLHFETLKSDLEFSDNITDLSTKTSLLQLSALLKDADLLVSTDSGPAHLANSLKTPVIVFFGAGIVEETAPYMKEHRRILDFNNIDERQLITEIWDSLDV